MDPDSDMKSVGQSLTALATRVSNSGSIDTQTRSALQNATQKLSLALETPGDAFQRIVFLPLQTTVIRIALDLCLFEKLGQTGPDGKSIHELEKETGADPVLLTRILRYLAVTGVVNQTSQNHYAATPISKALSSPVSQAGVKHFYDFVTPAFYKLPAYFAKTKYKNPTDALNGPFQYAYDTQLHGFAWIMQPENSTLFNNFNTWHAGSHEGRPNWLDWFPFDEEVVKGLERDERAVTVVDVGGGLGQELLGLKEKYPELPGRLVLQDLPETIKGVPETRVFEPTVYDFFTPQPVKGARVYYFRNVLHDWHDDKSQLILKNTIPAMRKGYSKIILNEMVIPDVGAGRTETQWDWTMLACLSAMERTEQQWRDLLTSVGLKVVKIWTHPDSTDSIIEAVPV